MRARTAARDRCGEAVLVRPEAVQLGNAAVVDLTQPAEMIQTEVVEVARLRFEAQRTGDVFEQLGRRVADSDDTIAAVRIASVIIPTGLVKLMIHAEGASALNLPGVAHHVWMVRSAIAKPAGPTVSWPTMPWRCATASSRIRSSVPPTLMLVKTNAAPLTQSATDVHNSTGRADIAAARPPMIGRRA